MDEQNFFHPIFDRESWRRLSEQEDELHRKAIKEPGTNKAEIIYVDHHSSQLTVRYTVMIDGKAVTVDRFIAWKRVFSGKHSNPLFHLDGETDVITLTLPEKSFAELVATLGEPRQ